MTYRYTDDELREIAGRARTLAADAEHVMVAFANGLHALEAASKVRAA
jgi:hypothetical protein